MSTDEIRLTVDRVEGSFAVLVSETGETIEVDVDQLPDMPREGAVLLVQGDATGLEWSTARFDTEEERHRLERAEETLAELRKRDRGGDVQL